MKRKQTQIKKLDLHITLVEKEAYDFAGQLCLPPHQIRCHVEHRKNFEDQPIYVIVVDATEAWERAVAIRRKKYRNYEFAYGDIR
jgi:hypothetical protein